MVTRQQARQAGVAASDIDNKLRRGEWQRLLPSVYLVGAAPESSAALSRVHIRAAFLWAGPTSVISGHAAAFWHGFIPAPACPIEIVVAPHRRLDCPAGLRVLRRKLDPADVVQRGGVQLTSPCRTALDFAARGCSDVLDWMLRRGEFDLQLLTETLNRGVGQKGWTQARQAVLESASRPFSAAERILHRELIRAGVTGWRANVAIRIGSRTVIPDLMFEDCGLIIEIDGHAHHSDRAAFESDRDRQNLLVGAGYIVLRFTWTQLTTDLPGVMGQICAALSRRRAHSGGSPR